MICWGGLFFFLARETRLRQPWKKRLPAHVHSAIHGQRHTRYKLRKRGKQINRNLFPHQKEKNNSSFRHKTSSRAPFHLPTHVHSAIHGQRHTCYELRKRAQQIDCNLFSHQKEKFYSSFRHKTSSRALFHLPTHVHSAIHGQRHTRYELR